MINKHIALKEWVQEYLDGNNMHFEDIDMYPGFRSLVPSYGDYVVKTDVIGNKYKTYTFAFVAIELLDMTDDTTNNTDIFYQIELFNEWLEEQQELKNFPNFGGNTSNYKIIPLQNMPNMAMVDEQNNAKYMMLARIDYTENESEV